MTYSAYLVGPDGHIQGRVDLICADDEAAKERAVQLVSGDDVELWQGDRRIAEFKSCALEHTSRHGLRRHSNII